MAEHHESSDRSGPLAGIKVIELAGKGPVPFCAMLLADLGADVLKLDRIKQEVRFPPRDARLDAMNRGRRSIAIDMKRDGASDVVLRLIERADVLIEGFRPGVMERLGVGPDACLSHNPRLVYGRATGWGQNGPLSQAPAHDINYLALSGLLNAMRRGKDDKPMPPLNVLGDYAAGGLMLGFGIASALVERSHSHRGQVIDAAMVDGLATFGTLYHGLMGMGQWDEEPGTKVYDTAAPYYDVYRTADGKFVAIGAIEPAFYTDLLRRIGLSNVDMPPQNDKTQWSATKQRFTEIFARKTRQEWCDLLEGTDACFAPVLSFGEATDYPHHKARQAYVQRHETLQPAPAPRFSRTPAALHLPPPRAGEHTSSGLTDWGFLAAELKGLLDAGVVAQTS